MSKQFWHCEKCGGNFDHGESCDCKKEEPKLLVSETLILGIDISGGKDISCVQVGKVRGNSSEIINTFYGEEAEWMYQRLINRGGVVKV